MNDGLKLCCCAAVITLLGGISLYSGPEPVFAGEKKTCGKQVAVKGFPSKIETVASLSAVRLWTEAAQKRNGPEYSMWHNAGRMDLKCIFVQKSEYIMCIAKGLPCKALNDSGKTAANTN